MHRCSASHPSSVPRLLCAGLILGTVYQAPQSAHADPGIPSTATQIDQPSQFSYAGTRSECTTHAHLTDIVKDIGLGIDQQVRKSDSVSLEEEREIGDDAIHEATEHFGGRLDQSSPTALYIAQVGNSLLPHIRRTGVHYNFYLLEDTEVENAFALPGGHVIITRPFFDEWIKNEAQLAAILGHEIAHVDEKHPLAAVQYARHLGMEGDQIISQILVWLATSPYSSALEEEADRVGSTYLHTTGYSIFQAVKMWEVQADRQDTGSIPGSENGGLLGGLLNVAVGEIENLVSSHPDAARRACLLEQVAYDRFNEDPKDRVYVGTTNLQRQIPLSQTAY